MNGICHLCNQMILAPPVMLVPPDQWQRLQYQALAETMSRHLIQQHPEQSAEIMRVGFEVCRFLASRLLNPLSDEWVEGERSAELARIVAGLTAFGPALVEVPPNVTV